MDELLRFDLQRFAEGDSNAGSNDGGKDADNSGIDTTGDGGQGHAGDGAAPKGDVKTFTQEELDRLIQQRLQRERKKWEQQLEEERRKAAMTEAERLKAEKEEAERRAKEAEAVANQRLIQAEAKVVALELGIKPERVAYAIRLANLSDVEVDENGQVDTKALKAALEQVIKDIPELKGTSTPAKSGADFQGGLPKAGDTNSIMNALIRRKAGRV